MIQVDVMEIPVEKIDDFWRLHMQYLVDDEIIMDDEDKEYFSGEEYRGIIKAHMLREMNRHHMVYFVRGEDKIGCAQFCIYTSEDGKCLVGDFWVFPMYRGNGTGHSCFQALQSYTRARGAIYYEINAEKENAIRFWQSIGFRENGVDEYGMKLFVLRADGE